MEIRILKPVDAEDYRRIRLEALHNSPESFATSYEEEKDQSVDKYKTRFQSYESYTFGAFENDQLVGVITLVKERLLKLRHRANIAAMYVSPKKRGLGIGKALLIEAIKKANELEGIEQVYLAVVTTNEPAKNLYSSLGFKAYGAEKRGLKLGNTYLDEDLMVLFI
jgi:RimJ/RimL family protein N-acetyltransferase